MLLVLLVLRMLLSAIFVVLRKGEKCTRGAQHRIRNAGNTQPTQEVSWSAFKSGAHLSEQLDTLIDSLVRVRRSSLRAERLDVHTG